MQFDEPLSCADRRRVLADQTRFAVVLQLMEGPKLVGEMNAVLGLDQSLLSHHLRVLRDNRLVEARVLRVLRDRGGQAPSAGIGR